MHYIIALIIKDDEGRHYRGDCISMPERGYQGQMYWSAILKVQVGWEEKRRERKKSAIKQGERRRVA